MKEDKEFVSGLFVKEPNENAPDFVKCSISIKRKDLGNWLRSKSDDWINLQVKVGKSGKWYAEVDNWKQKNKDVDGYPKNSQQANPTYQPAKSPDGWPDGGLDDDVPFMRPHDEYFG